MKTLNIALLVILLPIGVFAQYSWEGGIFAGGGFYFGDLTEQDRIPFFEETKIAAGVYTNYHFNPQWAFRMNATFAQLSGDDTNFEQASFAENRRFRFKTNMAELSLGFQWEPFGKWRYKEVGQFNSIVSPYLFAGVAGTYIDAQPDFSAVLTEGYFERIQEDLSEQGTRFEVAIPIGGGLKFDLNPTTTLGLEAGLRATFSDYIDGISQSAGSESNDWYAFGGLTLGFRFGTLDADRDGIVDAEDACPQLAGVASAFGCPDLDNDGVEDAEDICPDQPGIADLNGCPDKDGDRVIDRIDACPDTPGSEITEGCPDQDNDGIADSKDKCPDLPGFVEMNGCPDTDKDGIADSDDLCPEQEGIPELNGCPNVDADEDGLVDAFDDCPNLKGDKENNGCPEVTDVVTTDSTVVATTESKDTAATEDQLVAKGGRPTTDSTKVATTSEAEISENLEELLSLATKAVKFETGKSTLKEESLDILNQVAEAMKKLPGYELKIKGYTDSVGDDTKNKSLSEKRAKACFEYLIFKGLKGARMSFDGFGEENPIGDNNTPAGRRLNRRVEFELIKEEQQ
ncbi:MAG: DUF6089 family protein [Saprospiraceae bacterium]|nr:DUF6089 family protein [Saprospiraceae bacterium]